MSTTLKWVDCPKCDLQATCQYYANMKAEANKTKQNVCAKGCK